MICPLWPSLVIWGQVIKRNQIVQYQSSLIKVWTLLNQKAKFYTHELLWFSNNLLPVFASSNTSFLSSLLPITSLWGTLGEAVWSMIMSVVVSARFSLSRWAWLMNCIFFLKKNVWSLRRPGLNISFGILKLNTGKWISHFAKIAWILRRLF